MSKNKFRLGIRATVLVLSALMLAIVATACGSSDSGKKTIGFTCPI